jgi:NHLM bacteriocin system ABC transporter ATP-binding protein
MNFLEKVVSKKKKEREIFLDSFKKASTAALGGKEKVKNLAVASKQYHNVQIGKALDAVTDFYKMPRITLSKHDCENDSAFETAISRTGLTRRKIKLEGKWWVRGAGPLIAHTKTDNIVAILPGKFGGYQYISPNTNEVVRINSKTARNIEDPVYCFYKPFPNDKSMTIKDLVMYIMSSFSRFDVALLFLITTIVTVMGLVSPLISRTIYNKIIPSGTIKDIAPLAGLMVGIIISSNAISLFQSFWINRIGDKVRFATQGALWIRLLNLPLNFFKNYSSGDLATRTFKMNAVCNTISSGLLPAILSAAFSFIYLAQIFSISSAFVLPSFVIIISTLAFQLFVWYLNIKLNRKANDIAPKLSGLVYQLFTGISKIKVAGAEVRSFSKWAELYAKLSKIQFSPGLVIKISGAISSAISLAGTMWIYWMVYTTGISTADYMAYNVAYGQLSGAIMQLVGIGTSIASLKPTIELLEPILKEVPESNTNRTKVDSISGKIDINHLKFRYNEDSPYVINDLNLSFNPGEYVGIVGSTGCGKSTLFRLILGFEKPASGGVYFDNQSLDSLDLHSVRKRIGIVLQNGKLFADSIFANITITNPLANMDDAWAAAKKAGCAEDIEKMPMGMQTMISEEGGGISGGQKQRIMIARALISSPDLLMFDEATSALDNITQSIVVDTLAKMNITRVVIAHRLSTIKHCDRIVYLHEGKVAEEGTFEELMKLNGRFAELARRQIV